MSGKVNSTSYLDLVNTLADEVRSRRLCYLESEEDTFNGRHLQIDGNKLLNFGTCGYLGLETDNRLIESSIEYLRSFGTQYSVSRGFLTAGINVELEDLLRQIYQKPLLVYTSTSLAHISVIPIVVSSEDAVIFDQSVHVSIQTAGQLLRQKGVPIEMIRHSNMEMLEHTIKKLGNKFRKIWYMVDGVYSMYGDLAPLKEISELMAKYPQLHLYSDDAHGMSWYGKHGGGYVFDQFGVPERSILVTTLAKGFGSLGGIVIFPDEQTLLNVQNYGGPLSYSHPLAPAVAGAAIASAKIHLTDEIYDLQIGLKNRLDLANRLLAKTNIPVISSLLTPIYFIGLGQPKVGFNLLDRMLKEGFFLNIGIFPTVPIKNTGLRFTINMHQTFSDIENLVSALEYHYDKALQQEGETYNQVRKAFRMEILPESKNIPGGVINNHQHQYSITHETSIDALPQKEWDEMFAAEGVFDWEGMRFLEKSFSGNELPEDNWDFHYYVVRDENQKPVLATFFTVGIFKDDMLAQPDISKQLEIKRNENPYHFTSVTITMGSLYSLGRHLYLDRSNPGWKQVLKMMLVELDKLQEKTGASNTFLRDFDAGDTELTQFLLEEGFFRINVPDSNIIQDASWQSNDEYLLSLSPRNRRHVKYESLRLSHMFDVEIKSKLSAEETEEFYKMYLNVKDRNYALNFFPYAKKSFEMLSEYPKWEIIKLSLKHEIEPSAPVVAYCAGYFSGQNYHFEVVGMDYDFVFKYNVYKQALYQVVKRAWELGAKKVFLGLTADLEKRKVGASQIKQVAYVQTRDNFNFEVIESMAVESAR